MKFVHQHSIITRGLVVLSFLFSFVIVSAQIPRNTIRVETATQLEDFLRFGRGGLVDTLYSVDGETIIVATEIGVWLYDANNLEAEPQRLDSVINTVSAIAQSADGVYLAIAGSGNTIQIWNMTSGEMTQSLTGHERVILSMSFSPDGTQLVSGDFAGQMMVWDIDSGDSTHTEMPHGNAVTTVAYSPDGAYLISSGNDRTMRLWNTETWSEIAFEEDNVNIVDAFVFDSMSEHVYIKDFGNQISKWALPDLTRIRTYEGLDVDALTFDSTPDSTQLALSANEAQLLAISADEQSVMIWHEESGEMLTTLSHGDELGNIALSPDGKQVITMGNDVYIWDLETEAISDSLTGFYGEFTSLAFVDGEILALGNDDNRIVIWDIADDTIVTALDSHTDGVTSLALHPDGAILASGSFDGTIILWDTETWDAIRTIPIDFLDVRDVAFSPDGDLIAGVTGFGFKLFSVADGTEQAFLQGDNTARAIAFNPTGDLAVASFQDSSLVAWDIASGEIVGTYTENRDDITDFHFYGDTNFLVTVSWDASLQILDLSDFSFRFGVIAHDFRIWSVALTPSSDLIATGSVAELKVWDSSSGEEVATYTPHTHRINAIAVSPRSRILATASSDGTVNLLAVTGG